MSAPPEPAPESLPLDPGWGDRWGVPLAVAAVVLISINLRPGTAVGPLLEEIVGALGQGSVWAGVLTALPGVCFALFGFAAVPLATRIGVHNTLWIGMALVAGGLLARPWIPVAPLFLILTGLALGGMSLGNVLLPAFIKRRFPGRVAVMMTVYSVLLAVGATIANAVEIPLAEVLPGGWRTSLALWGVAAAVAVVPMLLIAVRYGPARLRRRTGGSGPSLLHSRRAIALGIFFGIQSLQAYTQFGWAPQIFRDGGVGAHEAGLLISLIAAFGIPAGLVMPTVVERVHNLRPIIVTMGLLLVAGYLGLLWAPAAAPWVWAVCLGLSGWAFPMALALVTARSRDHHITARLSGFGQSVGYALAALGPFLVGLLHGATGSWVVPLWLLIATAVPFVVAGWIACAPGYVDDDLVRTRNGSVTPSQRKSNQR